MILKKLIVTNTRISSTLIGIQRHNADDYLLTLKILMLYIIKIQELILEITLIVIILINQNHNKEFDHCSGCYFWYSRPKKDIKRQMDWFADRFHLYWDQSTSFKFTLEVQRISEKQFKSIEYLHIFSFFKYKMPILNWIRNFWLKLMFGTILLKRWKNR